MNQAKMNRQIFEAMLKAAVEERFEQELQKLPKNEALSNAYELSLPAQTKIKKMMRASHWHSILKHAGKIAKKAAVIVAVMIPVSFGSLLTVEASRTAIFNALLEWKSEHANILYQDSQFSSPRKSGFDAAEPRYLPKGFTEYKRTKSGPVTETEYRNEQEEKILLSQGPLSSGGNIGVDTEHNTETEIEIQGEKAFLFTADSSDENSYLAWNNHNQSFILTSKIAPRELIKIAENIGE